MILFALLLIPFTYLMLALLIKKAGIKKRLAILFSTLNLLWAMALVPIVQYREIIVVQMGGWSAPFGISLVADRFSVLMLLVTAFIFFLITVYATQRSEERRVGKECRARWSPKQYRHM